jgi:hypothetical protein
MTDFTVRNNILINFNSHNNSIDPEYLNNFLSFSMRKVEG